MPAIMGDHDVEGYFQELIRLCMAPAWRVVWEGLNLSVETFASLGLAENAPDVVVWQTCQARQVLLVTGNRNQEGPDSLEATIRQFNRPDSLPVFTIGEPRRFSSKSYAERAAERLLEYLFDIDAYRGTGRLYIP
jgi:hypothetical protein